jgi:hypothetical protein
MSDNSQFTDAALWLQTLQPRFRWRTVFVFAAIICALVLTTIFKHGASKAYYAVLATAAALALTVQYRRERILVANRLLATAVVTEHRKPLQSQSRWLNFILSRFTGNIPVMTYSFVAFDQKTYEGRTGWGAHSLFKGARMPVLYNPQDPGKNHPLASFIFYSFEQA